MGLLLITGASGFVGKAFLKHIESNHPERTKDIVLLSSSPSPKYRYLLYGAEYSTSYQTYDDIRGEQIDALFILGAFTPKRKEDADAWQANLSSTKSVVQLLSALPCVPSTVIYCSTLDVYAPHSGIINEENACAPLTFYGASKLYCEKIVTTWCKENQTIAQVLRLGHIYGRGEEAYQKLIPQTIRKVYKNETPIIFTEGNELRSFLHIKDCVTAIWNSQFLNEYKGVVNIVTDDARSIKEVVNTIISVSGKKLEVEILGKPLETIDYRFDHSKMVRLLGAPSVNFADGIRDEYEHFDHGNGLN